MPIKKKRKTRKTRREKLTEKIEQAIYDYVYENFGRTEAECPSWSTPGLAYYVADAVLADVYVPIHPIIYDEN